MKKFTHKFTLMASILSIGITSSTAYANLTPYDRGAEPDITSNKDNTFIEVHQTEQVGQFSAANASLMYNYGTYNPTTKQITVLKNERYNQGAFPHIKYINDNQVISTWATHIDTEGSLGSSVPLMYAIGTVNKEQHSITWKIQQSYDIGAANSNNAVSMGENYVLLLHGWRIDTNYTTLGTLGKIQENGKISLSQRLTLRETDLAPNSQKINASYLGDNKAIIMVDDSPSEERIDYFILQRQDDHISIINQGYIQKSYFHYLADWENASEEGSSVTTDAQGVKHITILTLKGDSYEGGTAMISNAHLLTCSILNNNLSCPEEGRQINMSGYQEMLSGALTAFNKNTLSAIFQQDNNSLEYLIDQPHN